MVLQAAQLRPETLDHPKHSSPRIHSITTPHVASGFFPFFLTYGREALLRAERDLDEPRLDPTSSRRLRRLWKWRVLTYEAQAQLEKRIRELEQKTDAPLPVVTLVMTNLTPQEKTAYPSNLVPIFKALCVIAGFFPDGKTYKVRGVG